MAKSLITQELNVNDILIAEYEYISKTISETNKDREKLAGFFNLIGTTVSAVGGLILANKIVNKTDLFLGLSGLFMVLTVVGSIVLAEIARLRAAWHEAAAALNQIKNFYISCNREIEPAFKWRSATLPPTDKPYSLANLLALEVTFLSASFGSASMYCLLVALGSIEWWGWVLIVATLVVGSLSLRVWYKHLLIGNR
jgi:hypothetical protein